LITDALGSVLAQIKPDGSQAASYVYSPYGQTRISVAGGELSLGGASLNATEANASLYTAREYEGTNLGTVAPGANQNAQTASQGELYYYRARYYDPVLKRFISEDPIGLRGGFNLFEYVGGNPVARIDPNGLSPEEAGLPPPATPPPCIDKERFCKLMKENNYDPCTAWAAALNARQRGNWNDDFYRPVENLAFAACETKVGAFAVAGHQASKFLFWPLGESSPPSFCALNAGFAGLGLRDPSSIRAFCNDQCR
jgi:RHS repeat-associated protein